eukprot:1155503-Pelagomonas_calceolata.AAC.2
MGFDLQPGPTNTHKEKKKNYAGRGNSPYINQGQKDTLAQQKSRESPPPVQHRRLRDRADGSHSVGGVGWDRVGCQLEKDAILELSLEVPMVIENHAVTPSLLETSMKRASTRTLSGCRKVRLQIQLAAVTKFGRLGPSSKIRGAQPNSASKSPE